MARDSGRIPWWARVRWPVVSVLVLSAVFIARASYISVDGRSFTLFDDAMVSMRFARNLADGHGLVYNAGQPAVEGYTNFLWTIWMAALHLVPVPIRFVPLLVSISGAAFVAVSVALVGALARRLAPDEPVVAAIAMWTTAIYYPLLYWTLRGLEPGLLAAGLAAAVLVAWRIRDRAAAESSMRDALLLAAVLSAGVLTRTDFLVVAVVVIGWLLWPGATPASRHAAFLALGIVFLVLAAHTGFRLAYYDELLPNTYTLKVEGVALTTRLDRGSRALAWLVLTELALALVLAAVTLVSRRSARVALLAALFVAVALYSVFVGGDAWEYLEYANRYVTPVVPLLLVLAAIGVVEVAALPRAHQSLVLLGMVAAVAAAAFVNAQIKIDPEYNLRVAALISELDREHRIVAVGAVALLLVAIPGARVTENRAFVVAPIIGALVIAVTLPAWLEWGRDSGHLVRRNAYEARLGLGLRDVARRDASIAVVAAGNIPYWSELATVDLLGKSDPVIARGRSRAQFDPGHSKWDYRHSICRLRPDVVVQLFQPSRRDRHLIEQCGYEQVIGDYYARRDQTGFPREPLSRVIYTTR